MTLALVQLTIDRRQLLQLSGKPHPENANNANYLGRTLQNLEASGIFASKTPWTLDIVDSGSPEQYPVEQGVPPFVVKGKPNQIHWHSGWMRNANENFLEALKIGATRKADWVIFIEDDIAVIKNFVDAVANWLDDHATNKCHVYVFGAECRARKGEELDGPSDPKALAAGEWDYPPGKFMGTQAIGFRQSDCLSIIDGLSAYKPFTKTKHGYDCELRRWAETTYGKDTPFRCTSPSFVQHIGDESAIALGRFHTYLSFPGPDWTYTKRGKTVQFVVR